MPVRELLEKIEHGFHWMSHGDKPRPKRVRNYKLISILALIALVLQGGLLLLALFEPGLPYKVARGPAESLADPHFAKSLEALAGAQLYQNSKFQVLTNGENFYTAELAAIQKAKRSINIEAYIFSRGEVADRFVKALAERARAGVQVNVIIDAIGAFSQTKAYFDELTDAGGKVYWYHPIRWNTWPRINNRTHRELMIIDGNIGFIGGAGIANHWLKQHGDDRRWRDTMVRVEGGAVTGLQAAFSENWLNLGRDPYRLQYFPFQQTRRRRPPWSSRVRRLPADLPAPACCFSCCWRPPQRAST